MDEQLSSEDVEAYITDLTNRFGFLEEAIAESETTMVELQQELTRISESPPMEQGERIDAVVEELTEAIEQAGSNHDLSALKRELAATDREWKRSVTDEPDDLLDNYSRDE